MVDWLAVYRLVIIWRARAVSKIHIRRLKMDSLSKKRDHKVATMITSDELEALNEIIADRAFDGERVTLSTLVRFLAFHPENKVLDQLLYEARH